MKNGLVTMTDLLASFQSYATYTLQESSFNSKISNILFQVRLVATKTQKTFPLIRMNIALEKFGPTYTCFNDDIRE